MKKYVRFVDRRERLSNTVLKGEAWVVYLWIPFGVLTTKNILLRIDSKSFLLYSFAVNQLKQGYIYLVEDSHYG